MNTFSKIILSFVLLFGLYFAMPVLAANVFFDVDNQAFAPGEEFLVSVFLNTEKESLNAIEGKIIFPADLIEAKEIRNGNSAINFWIEKPNISSLGEIVFSGITPGGLNDSKNFLFSVVYRALENGNGELKLEGLRVLKNDGLGTLAITKTSPFVFSISPSSSTTVKTLEPIQDLELPEDFLPIIESDPSIFDGQYFLVFATQDKLSGLNRYEVREGAWGWYRIAESPYLLKNQALDKKIFVKAIDEAGNTRIAILEARNQTPWYQQYEIFVILIIIIVLIIIIGFLFKKLWQRFIK